MLKCISQVNENHSNVKLKLSVYVAAKHNFCLLNGLCEIKQPWLKQQEMQ